MPHRHRNHHVLNVAEGNLVVVQILTKGSIERCHRVGSLDAQGLDDFAVAYSDNLRCRYSYVYSYNNFHTVSMVVIARKVSVKAGLDKINGKNKIYFRISLIISNFAVR